MGYTFYAPPVELSLDVGAAQEDSARVLVLSVLPVTVTALDTTLSATFPQTAVLTGLAIAATPSDPTTLVTLGIASIAPTVTLGAVGQSLSVATSIWGPL